MQKTSSIPYPIRISQSSSPAMDIQSQGGLSQNTVHKCRFLPPLRESVFILHTFPDDSTATVTGGAQYQNILNASSLNPTLSILSELHISRQKIHQIYPGK